MEKRAVALSISEDVRNDILRGRIRPGEPLRIRSLAERFGTSDLPVREALWILQKDGLVENRPYAGAFVRVHSAREISEAYEIRSALERVALLKTPAEPPASLLSELESMLSELEGAAAEQDAIRYGDLNRSFHQRLVSASVNQSVLELLDRLWSGQSAYRSVFSSNHRRIAQSHAEHQEIFEAFAQGDMSRTADLLEQHRLNGIAAAVESIVQEPTTRSEGTGN